MLEVSPGRENEAKLVPDSPGNGGVAGLLVGGMSRVRGSLRLRLMLVVGLLWVANWIYI